MSATYSELHALRAERRAYAQAVLEIREATGLRTVPLAQLAGAIEDIISNLAVQNVILADGQPEPGPTVDDIADAVADGYEIQWAPEDVVVPAHTKTCRGCLRLVELDGRLTCSEARSTHAGATLIWPGPGCAWMSDCDEIYGGRR